MLLGQRNHDTVVGRGRLKLEVKGTTEALSERQAPRPVHPDPQRRVQDELHAASFVEEALGHNRPCRRQGAQGLGPGSDIGQHLLGTGVIQTALIDKESGGPGPSRCLDARGPPLQNPPADGGHLVRKLRSPSGSLTSPKRHRGGGAVGILNPYATGLDPADLPRACPQQKDVTGHAFDREILIDGSDRRALRLGRHQVIGIVGNGPSGRDRRQTPAPASSHHVVDSIAVQVGAVAPAVGRDPLRQHGD